MAPANNCMICAYPSTLACSVCKSAWYCGTGCQRLAWGHHKKLCKILKLDPAQRPAKTSYCALCGKTDGETYVTDCCGETICDDTQNYVLMSYARNSCSRNHDRYTACGRHYTEGHYKKPGDQGWKHCEQCVGDNASWGAESTAWYSTNNYCTGERIDQELVPEFKPSVCIKCKKEVKLQLETHSLMGGNDVICGSCPV